MQDKIRVGLRSNAIPVKDLIRAIHQRGVFEASVFVRGNLGLGRNEEYFDFTTGNDVATMLEQLDVTIS